MNKQKANEIQQAIEQYHHYPLLFSTITGSHGFGIASPHSDFDIHGAHLLPLRQQLGFDSNSDTTVEIKTKISANIELDVMTHDLKKLLMLLIKGNGNILEDVYSPLIVHTSPLHNELKALGKGCITKSCALHYKGMAFNQQRRIQEKNVKMLIHLYRCLLMGIHLMRSGQLLMDIPQLAKEYDQRQLLRIIEYKYNGIKRVDDEEIIEHMTIVEQLTQRLDREQEQSQLPERTSKETSQKLEDLLVNTRLNT